MSERIVGAEGTTSYRKVIHGDQIVEDGVPVVDGNGNPVLEVVYERKIGPGGVNFSSVREGLERRAPTPPPVISPPDFNSIQS